MSSENFNIIAYWFHERPECLYFKDILKLDLLHACSLFATVYLVDKFVSLLKHLDSTCLEVPNVEVVKYHFVC